jgi:hypothetical protein
MSVVYDYSVRWRFTINHAKCGLMCFPPSGSALPTTVLTIGDKQIPWVAVYKYLGVELHAGVPFSQFRARMLQSATRAAFSVAGLGMHSGKLPVPLGTQVYTALVRPLLEYCAEVCSVTPWPAAENVQVAMGKRILQVSSRTCNEAIRGELGWQSMEARFLQARLCFWGKLHLAHEDSPARIVFEYSQWQYAASIAGDAGIRMAHLTATAQNGWEFMRAPTVRDGLVPWVSQLQYDLFSTGFAAKWRDPASLTNDGMEKWKANVTAAVKLRERERWWRAIHTFPLLRTYCDLKRESKNFAQECYLTVRHGGWNDRTLAGRRFLTRLRTGFSELRINTGRWEDLEAHERMCKLCEADVETEEHFLLHCAARVDERAVLFAAIDSLVNAERDADDPSPLLSFASLPAVERLRILTGATHPAIAGEKLRRRVLSKILATLADWTAQRSQLLEEIAAIHLVA